MDHLLNATAWFSLIVQAILFAALAPLFVGIIKKTKARLQNRQGASVIQPYRDLWRLFGKQVMVAETASPIFSLAPYIVFGASLLVVSAVPFIMLDKNTLAISDMIALIGIMALSRFFLTLAGMDIGTAFGGMGASREMMVSSLAEPATLLAVFTLAMHAHSTNLVSIISFHLNSPFALSPSYLFALLGLLLVAVAETGRIPVDNPATHLELTMIHEAMILEYSGRHLALMEWAAQLKLLFYAVLISNMFFPWGIATEFSAGALFTSAVIVALKLFVLAIAVAVMETVFAKMRVFRVPQYLNLALLLSLLGLFSFIILETGA